MGSDPAERNDDELCPDDPEYLAVITRFHDDQLIRCDFRVIARCD
jgi:hypothetical protein